MTWLAVVLAAIALWEYRQSRLGAAVLAFGAIALVAIGATA